MAEETANFPQVAQEDGTASKDESVQGEELDQGDELV
jgi:hypothetical protein